MVAANYINHIALVLDASGSMQGRESEVIAVSDNLVQHLAQRSKELDQETRVTIYSFDNRTECLIYDKDVLRMPSISHLYRVNGSTSLIDATIKSLEDLSKTPELYGEHAFLVYVLTDGEENASHSRPSDLSTRLDRLPDHWTVAVFVPNQTGVHEAKRFGFPKDNIQIWDTNAKLGLESVGETIRKTTDTFMQARTQGVRGSRNLFNLDLSKVNVRTVAKSLDKYKGASQIFRVKKDSPINSFIEQSAGVDYKLGNAYYQLSKSEKVQKNKRVALVSRVDGDVYVGYAARDLLGLPDHEVKINAADHPDFSIFIQSTSVNRKLISGTDVLYFY